MDKRMVRKWVAALRSGRYKRGSRFLQNRNRFCVIGVLTDLNSEPTKNFGFPNRAHHPKTLKMLGNVGPYIFGNSLVALSDSGKFSFDELADLIELKYLHGVENDR